MKPLPTFSLIRMETSLDPLLATIRSGRPSPLTSATVMPAGFGAREEAVTAVERRAEGPVAQAGVDQDVVAAAVGDDQVENPVVVEVRQLDRARRDQSRGRVAQYGRDAADGPDDELISELIGEDERGRRASVGPVDRQRDLLVEVLDGLERAVAVRRSGPARRRGGC